MRLSKELRKRAGSLRRNGFASELEILTRSTERPTVELFAGGWGVIDSREQPKSQVPQTALGELIACKLEGQDLSRPK